MPTVIDAYRRFWDGEDQHTLIAGGVPWEVAASLPAVREAWRLIARDGLGPALDRDCPVVLEVGCGVGRLAPAIVELPATYVGVDISPQMVRTAVEDNHLMHAWLIAGDGTFPISTGTIDFAFSFLVFQHMPTREVVRRTLAETLRVLKPGGLFRVQTHAGTPHDEGTFGGWHGRFYPDLAAFAAEFRQAGFEVAAAQAGLGWPDWLWVTARKPGGG